MNNIKIMKLKKIDIGVIVIAALFIICGVIAMFKSCSYEKYAITYVKGDSIDAIVINDTVVGEPKLEVVNDTYVIKAKNKDISSNVPLTLKSVEKVKD